VAGKRRLQSGPVQKTVEFLTHGRLQGLAEHRAFELGGDGVVDGVLEQLGVDATLDPPGRRFLERLPIKIWFILRRHDEGSALVLKRMILRKLKMTFTQEHLGSM